jgi:quercetin dioxygenase-like cupin family protein
MNSVSDHHHEEHLDVVFLYALQALPASEMPVVEAQISQCVACRVQLEALRPIIASFVSWPTDVLRPVVPLWGRVAQRIAADTGKPLISLVSQLANKPEWEDPAPGISYQLLATDTENECVSMLVRLAPGADYPRHRHVGVEELYLLHGELMIDAKKVSPGDYVRAEAGTVDHRVWTDTGCTCVLITSTGDVLL